MYNQASLLKVIEGTSIHYEISGVSRNTNTVKVSALLPRSTEYKSTKNSYALTLDSGHRALTSKIVANTVNPCAHHSL